MNEGRQSHRHQINRTARTGFAPRVQGFGSRILRVQGSGVRVRGLRVPFGPRERAIRIQTQRVRLQALFLSGAAPLLLQDVKPVLYLGVVISKPPLVHIPPKLYTKPMLQFELLRKFGVTSSSIRE